MGTMCWTKWELWLADFVKLHKTHRQNTNQNNENRIAIKPLWEYLGRKQISNTYMAFLRSTIQFSGDCRIVTFCNSKVLLLKRSFLRHFASKTPPWVLFTFLKLHKWYQIMLTITCFILLGCICLATSSRFSCH